MQFAEVTEHDFLFIEVGAFFKQLQHFSPFKAAKPAKLPKCGVYFNLELTSCLYETGVETKSRGNVYILRDLVIGLF